MASQAVADAINEWDGELRTSRTEKFQPIEVIVKIEDVLISARCRVTDLPLVIQALYQEARGRNRGGKESFYMTGLRSTVGTALHQLMPAGQPS